MTKIAALLMAAGNSRRMGGPNKLLLPFKAEALVEYAITAVAKAKFDRRFLVTGRDFEHIENYGAGFEIIHNPRFAEGFGTSLSTGFAALLSQPELNGALVMLADMPLISATHLDRMIVAFNQVGSKSVVRAAHHGQPGNPVIIPNPLFADMAKLVGEQSGQAIIKASGLPIIFCEIGPAALADIDTPEALAALQEADL